MTHRPTEILTHDPVCMTHDPVIYYCQFLLTRTFFNTLLSLDNFPSTLHYSPNSTRYIHVKSGTARLTIVRTRQWYEIMCTIYDTVRHAIRLCVCVRVPLAYHCHSAGIFMHINDPNPSPVRAGRSSATIELHLIVTFARRKRGHFLDLIFHDLNWCTPICWYAQLNCKTIDG